MAAPPVASRRSLPASTIVDSGARHAEGFFVPLFFVVLGARLDFSALLDHSDLVLVSAALIVLNLVIHAFAALATRRPPSAGLIATAQLGVPAAVAQIGLQEHVITPALGAAITVAALATLGLCALGTERLARRTEPLPEPPKAPGPSPPPVAALNTTRKRPDTGSLGGVVNPTGPAHFAFRWQIAMGGTIGT